MPLVSHFNGSKKPKRVRDADLKDAVSLLPSARQFMRPPNYMPNDPKAIEELAFELIDWSQQEDAVSLDDFFSKKVLSPRRFIEAAKEYEALSSAYEIACSNIASRLQKGLNDIIMYKLSKEKQYSCMSRAEARERQEADREQKVITTYVEEKIQIPVFKRSKE